MKLKQFINTFNFENPNWENLPEGFFSFQTKTLTREERGLYEGIVFAWLTEKSLKIEKGFSGLFLAANIFFLTSLFVLITGNLLNLILIEVYHTIL